MTERAIVWDRTSGGEDEEQDAPAQAAGTAQRAKEAGFDVRGVYYDEEVPGDVLWKDRPQMWRALELAQVSGAVFVVRSPTRLWRGRPSLGLVYFEGEPDIVPNLEVLGKPHWSRRGGSWVHDDDGDELYRFLDLWQSWGGKRFIKEETRAAMREIKEGRRATESGKPHHRPPIEYDPAHLEAARDVYARSGSVSEAHREFQRLRGYYEAKDPRTQKARSISRAKVGQLLGVYSVTKRDVSERGEAPAEASSITQGSLADGGSPAVAGQNSRPVVSAGSPAAGGAGRGQAVTDGGA